MHPPKSCLHARSPIVCARVQSGTLPANFHEADTKTIRRLLDVLLQRGVLLPAVQITIPAKHSKKRLGVSHERAVTVLPAADKVRAC